MSNYQTKFMDPFITKASIGPKASLCEKKRLFAENRQFANLSLRQKSVTSPKSITLYERAENFFSKVVNTFLGL